MTTQKTIAKEAMREIKALSEVGVVVINRADLETLINNAIQSGVELGMEYARRQAARVAKTSVGLSLRTKSVPFDDEEDSLLMDDEDDPQCGACTKGDPPDDDGFDGDEDDREFRDEYDDQ